MKEKYVSRTIKVSKIDYKVYNREKGEIIEGTINIPAEYDVKDYFLSELNAIVLECTIVGESNIKYKVPLKTFLANAIYDVDDSENTTSDEYKEEVDNG